MTSFFQSCKRGFFVLLAFIWVYLTFFYRGTFIVLTLVLLAVWLPSILRADGSYPAEWDEDYPMYASDIKLFDAFEMFARSYQVGVVLDRDIEDDDVRARNDSFTAVEYLDIITRQFSLQWYFDGSVVQIFPISKIETRILPIRITYASSVVQTLKELGVYQPQFVHRVGQGTQTLRITGPKSYIDMVEMTIQAMEISRRVDVRIRRGVVVVDYQDIQQTDGAVNVESDDVVTP